MLLLERGARACEFRPGCYHAIHWSAWKWNSQKFACKNLHSAAHVGSETSDSPVAVPNPKLYI
jgi:hypothetical protein